ncbi:MAG: hypothetical protein ACOC4C_05490 [Fibrobacterota bacterium]
MYNTKHPFSLDSYMGRYIMKNYVLTLVLFTGMLIGCSPAWLNSGRMANGSGSDCSRVQMHCDGEYHEHTDKDGNRYCSCERRIPRR